MAKETKMVCPICGCEIEVTKEPSKSGYGRNFTYCPVCKNSMMSFADYERKMLHTVNVENLMRRFGLKSKEDEKVIADRLKSAKELVSNVKYIGYVDYTKVYGVTASDGKDAYVVTKKDGMYTCNCKDHLFRHGACKHIIAVMLFQEKHIIDPFV